MLPKPGNSNKAIWRSIKEQLLNANDITHLIVLWSALERVEVLNLDYHHQYDIESGPRMYQTQTTFLDQIILLLKCHQQD